MATSNEYTLQGFISKKSNNQISYNNLSVLETCDSKEIYFSIHNLIDDYLDEILSMCVEVTLSKKEVLKYQYRPWLLAYDIYKEPEIYWIIMVLNDIPTPNEFEDIEILKLPYVDDLANILSSIYESESVYLARNRESLL